KLGDRVGRLRRYHRSLLTFRMLHSPRVALCAEGPNQVPQAMRDEIRNDGLAATVTAGIFGQRRPDNDPHKADRQDIRWTSRHFLPPRLPTRIPRAVSSPECYLSR